MDVADFLTREASCGAARAGIEDRHMLKERLQIGERLRLTAAARRNRRPRPREELNLPLPEVRGFGVTTATSSLMRSGQS